MVAAAIYTPNWTRDFIYTGYAYPIGDVMTQAEQDDTLIYESSPSPE